MWISKLELTNFRCYEQIAANFDSGFNLIWGNNGLGKTNLVESIHFCSAFDSHRTTATTHLIRENESEATISATLNFSGRAINQVTKLSNPGQTKVWVNSSPKKKLSDAIGTTSSVIFAPEDLDTIRRDPSDRRKFIDQVVVQLQPRMAAVRADYDRSLRQRNALLKSFKLAGRRANGLSPDENRSLQSWDEQIVRYGSELTVARVSAIAQLAPGLHHFYQQLAAQSSQATITPRLSVYASSLDDELEEPVLPEIQFDPETFPSVFESKLASLRSKEIDRGVTLIGPHRDDIIFGLNNLPARFGSSQGEAWSLALGSKLAFAALLTELLPSGSPILLLDDVFAVLDPDRRHRLLAHLQNYEQVIITSTSKDGLPMVEWQRTMRLVSDPGHAGSDKNVKFEIEA
ncbi:MAG: replication/repair protein RecF [Actinomycetota bacterium]